MMKFKQSKIKIIFLKAISLALLFSLVLFLLISCDNPFAPKLASGGSKNAILGDQTTIEGVFENFRYSYIFKDTVVYGNLMSDNFTFIYRNYDKGIDESFSREEDMITTYGLFKAAQSLDLLWNEVIISVGDSLANDISRGFNLTIVFNPSDVVRIQGRVNLRLERKRPVDVWKIVRWRDESNY
ncbi:MAG: hypothetical protein WCT77_10480 [Bacteroidota bacterium]